MRLERSSKAARRRWRSSGRSRDTISPAAPTRRAVFQDLSHLEGRGPPRLSAVTAASSRSRTTRGAPHVSSMGPARRAEEPKLSEHRLTELLDGAPRAARPGAARVKARPRCARMKRSRGRRAAGGREPRATQRGLHPARGDLGAPSRRAPSTRTKRRSSTRCCAAPVSRSASVVVCSAPDGSGRASDAKRPPIHPARPGLPQAFCPRTISTRACRARAYADNGPFLGGAAGGACRSSGSPACSPRSAARADASGLWQRVMRRCAAAPAAPDRTTVLGFHLGEPGWWSLIERRRAAHGACREASSQRPARRRVGALGPSIPADPRDDALDATLSVAVAFNQLGPLYDNPHGRRDLSRSCASSRSARVGPRRTTS